MRHPCQRSSFLSATPLPSLQMLHPSIPSHCSPLPFPPPALALSELLEAYAACAYGAEVITAQHRWMKREAELAQARHASTDVPSLGDAQMCLPEVMHRCALPR
ncbi:unnamed protein product [Closterium sp. Naga37s-1]|nr:unnamed protein product [Closterium sp. Naga37s-1]